MLSPVAPARTTSDDSAVQADSVTVRYGSLHALSDVSVTLPSGAVTALIGPNGAGKSTLLHVLAGVCAPDRGTVSWGCRHCVAYVLQRSALPDSLPLTVRQAVAMGCWQRRGVFGRLDRNDRAAITAAMERMDIAHLARRQAGELSGGQRQRVLVAQALVQDAGLLLLDEPITGLDVAARERILEVIDDEAASGTIVVHTTHDLDDARRAQHVVLLSDGRVIAAGQPSDVVQRDVVAPAYGLATTAD